MGGSHLEDSRESVELTAMGYAYHKTKKPESTASRDEAEMSLTTTKYEAPLLAFSSSHDFAHDGTLNHNGARLGQDQQRYIDICRDLIAGEPLVDVAKRYSVGTASILAVYRRLEDRGLAEPMAKGNARRMHDLLGLLGHSLTDDVISNNLDGKTKGILFGILSDKVAQSGQIVTVHKHEVRISLDSIRDRLHIVTATDPASASRALDRKRLPGCDAIIDATIVKPKRSHHKKKPPVKTGGEGVIEPPRPASVDGLPPV